MMRDSVMRRMRVAGALAATAATLLLSPAQGLSGDSLSTPTGKVILTITGDIAVTNGDGAANFDLEMLHALGVTKLRTSTPWTDGTQEFEGVLMRDLLAAVGARGKAVEAIALNDYSFGIGMDDFDRYPVLLATTLNGNRLRVRDKGPLWIVYPQDEYAELRSEETDRKMVWQLRKLVVK